MKLAICVVSWTVFFENSFNAPESYRLGYLFQFVSGTCYERVKEETRAMQKIITEKLGLNPVDKEVIVLYDGEKDKVR